MNISSVVVRAFPAEIDVVSRRITDLDGAEVHGANPDGRLVVTVEKPDDRGLADALIELQTLPGVLSASMIYHQFEDLVQQEAE